jgi:hypothetical protein
MKNHMNHNHIRIQAIDTRRVDKIGMNSPQPSVSPSLPSVGEKPPKIVDQMRTRYGGDFVPKNGAWRVLCRAKDRPQPFNTLNPLRVNMDFPFVLVGQALDLFDDAEFGAVHPV